MLIKTPNRSIGYTILIQIKRDTEGNGTTKTTKHRLQFVFNIFIIVSVRLIFISIRFMSNTKRKNAEQ
jgi:hypothetical protein